MKITDIDNPATDLLSAKPGQVVVLTYKNGDADLAIVDADVDNPAAMWAGGHQFHRDDGTATFDPTLAKIEPVSAETVDRINRSAVARVARSLERSIANLERVMGHDFPPLAGLYAALGSLENQP